jgi:hypothetical protein
MRLPEHEQFICIDCGILCCECEDNKLVARPRCEKCDKRSKRTYPFAIWPIKIRPSINHRLSMLNNLIYFHYIEEEYQVEFLRYEKPNYLRFKYLRDPDCLTHVELAFMVDSGLFYAKNTIAYIHNCMLLPSQY